MDMEGYFSEVKAVAVEGFKRLNDTTQVEHKKWEVPVGSWDVSVVRGKVLEKATRLAENRPRGSPLSKVRGARASTKKRRTTLPTKMLLMALPRPPASRHTRVFLP